MKLNKNTTIPSTNSNPIVKKGAVIVVVVDGVFGIWRTEKII